MKNPIITAIAALCLWAVSLSGAAAEKNPASPVSQEIAVTLVPVEHLLKGQTTLDYAVRPDMVTLDLDPAALIDRVSSAGQSLSHTFHDGRLTITPAYAPTGSLSISIHYRLIKNDQMPDANAGSEDPSYGINGIISPQGVFLGSSFSWYPRPMAPPLRRTIRITAPVGMEAITAGERLSHETSERMTRSVWQEEPPVGDLALAAGPYPFSKFAVVENFFPTGYGFPSFTLLGSTVIRLPFITTTSLPHEIAHNWWGNGVLVDTGQGNWCEGLVTYLADQLLEERKGETAGREYRLRLLTDYALLVPEQLDFSLSRFSSRVDPASRAIGYGKGAMLWHMLRRQVGDEAFFSALREVFLSRRYQSATWSDFSQALGRNSGQKLDSFMTTWLERSGGPHLSLADVQKRRQGAKWLVTGRVVQKFPVFPLFLPLRLETASGKFDQTLPITGEQTPFHFLTDQAPRRLLLDPDVEIFRLLPASQLPANVNRLKGSSKLLGVTTRACGSGATQLRQLLETLGQGSAKIITEDELSKGGSRDHDLIFCGEPRGAAGLFDLPPGLELGHGSFIVNNERFSGEGDMLFLVTRQATAPERVAALFLPMSPSAAEGAITKISHYGNFATLVFSGGINRYKERVPQPTAGAQMTFSGEEQP